jgi:hypothetical protein
LNGFELRILSCPEEHNAFSYPRWNGEPVDDKTVLVYAEQGVGDEINCSLLFTEFSKMTKRCIVLCDPRLETLFKRSFANIEIMGVPRQNYPVIKQQLPPIDYQVAIGSLAKFIRPTLEGVKPSLVADPNRVEFWRDKLDSIGEEPKIGISWSTGLQNPLRMLTQAKLDQWGPILSVPGVTFVNLFHGNRKEEIDMATSSFDANIIDFGGNGIDLRDDIDDLYALISVLDLIVTTPGLIAALGCNMGSKSLYFYSTRLLFKTLGKDSIQSFMDASPLYFSNADEFETAVNKAGDKVRSLAELKR